MPEPIALPEPIAHLKAQGLEPRYKLQVRNLTIHYSDPFFAKQHLFVAAHIRRGSEETYTLFYRSNSHGLFKQLPSYFEKAPLSNSPWFDKGSAGSTLSITPPPEFQAALLAKLPAKFDKIPEYPFEQLNGIVPFFADLSDPGVMKLWGSAEYPGSKAFRKRPLLANTKPKFELPEGQPWRAPQDVYVEAPEDAPDFDKPLFKYRFTNGDHGEVQAEVYASKNRELEYTLLKSHEGRVFIADVGTRDEALTLHGLRPSYIDADELTAPLWERQSEIPYPFQTGPADAQGYLLNWPYLSRLPEIKRYYRERGIPPPP